MSVFSSSYIIKKSKQLQAYFFSLLDIKVIVCECILMLTSLLHSIQKQSNEMEYGIISIHDAATKEPFHKSYYFGNLTTLVKLYVYDSLRRIDSKEPFIL